MDIVSAFRKLSTKPDQVQPLVSNNAYLEGKSIAPDSDGVLALFVRRENTAQEEQWKGNYSGATTTTFALPGPWIPTVTSIDGYGIGRGTEPTDPLIARSIRTGVTAWQTSVIGDAILVSDLAAGAVQESNGTIRDIGSNGSVEATNTLPSSGILAFGRFHIRGPSNTLQAFTWKSVDDLTSHVRLSGEALQAAPNAFGLFVKTHIVAEVASEAMHAALRLVPRRQSDWQASNHPYSQYFREKPAYYGDLHYATVGAGTNSPVPSCNLGTLTAAINRPRDFTVFPIHHVRLLVSLAEEESKMLAALDATSGFQNGVLEYYCWPEPSDQKYNSNSFLHGLLLKVGLPEPTNISFTESLFPGWSKPVPAPYYAPPQ